MNDLKVGTPAWAGKNPCWVEVDVRGGGALCILVQRWNPRFWLSVVRAIVAGR